MEAFDVLEKLFGAAQAGRRAEVRAHTRAAREHGVSESLISKLLDAARPSTQPVGSSAGLDRKIARALRLAQFALDEGNIVPMSGPAIDVLGVHFAGDVVEAINLLVRVALDAERVESLVDDARSFGTAQLDDEGVRIFAYMAGAQLRVLISQPTALPAEAADVWEELSPSLIRLHDLIRRTQSTSDARERDRLLERVGATTNEMLVHMQRGAEGRNSTLPPPGGVDATPILQSVVNEAGLRSKGRGVAIRAAIEDDLRVYARSGDVRSIASNLLENALEASCRGGPVRLSAVRDGDFLDLRVEDDGMGMDLIAQERAFEPYFTTKDDGQGLGLPLVRHLVQRLSGTLIIESEVGAGTTMHVRLSRSAPTGK